MKKILFPLILLLAAMCLFVGCEDSETEQGDDTGETQFYSVTLEYDKTQGTLSVTPPAAGETYAQGETVTVSVLPVTGFVLDSLTVNGAEVNVVGGSYSFQIVSDVTVRALFETSSDEEEDGTRISFREEFRGVWTEGDLTITIEARAIFASKGGNALSAKAVSVVSEGKVAYVIELDEKTCTLSAEGSYVLVLEDEETHFLLKEGMPVLSIAQIYYGEYRADDSRFALDGSGIFLDGDQGILVGDDSDRRSGKYLVLLGGELYTLSITDEELTATPRGGEPVHYVRQEGDYSFPPTWTGTYREPYGDSELVIGAQSFLFEGKFPDSVTATQYGSGYNFTLQGKNYTVTWAGTIESTVLKLTAGEETHYYIKDGAALGGTIESKYAGDWRSGSDGVSLKIGTNSIEYDGAPVDWYVDIGQIDTITDPLGDIIIDAHCYYFGLDGTCHLLMWYPLLSDHTKGSPIVDSIYFTDGAISVPQALLGEWVSLDRNTTVKIDSSSVTINDEVYLIDYTNAPDIFITVGEIRYSFRTDQVMEGVLMIRSWDDVTEEGAPLPRQEYFVNRESLENKPVLEEGMKGIWTAGSQQLTVGDGEAFLGETRLELIACAIDDAAAPHPDCHYIYVSQDAALFRVMYNGSPMLLLDTTMYQYTFYKPVPTETGEGEFAEALRGVYALNEGGADVIRPVLVVGKNSVSLWDSYENGMVYMIGEGLRKTAENTYTFVRREETGGGISPSSTRAAEQFEEVTYRLVFSGSAVRIYRGSDTDVQYTLIKK